MKWKVRLVIQSLQQPEKVYVSVYKNLAVLPAPMFVAAVRSCSLEGYSCHYASVVSQKRRGRSKILGIVDKCATGFEEYAEEQSRRSPR